jgi:hypothetical protein
MGITPLGAKMTEAMAKMITSVSLALADRPGWLVAIISVLIIGLAVKLAFQNPKFWDLLTGLQHNTSLTREVLDTVKRVEDRQTGVIERLDKSEDAQRKLQNDLSFLTQEVEVLRSNACPKASTCLSRSIPAEFEG